MEKQRGSNNCFYHIGALIKDLGKKLFALSRMELAAEELINSSISICFVNNFLSYYSNLYFSKSSCICGFNVGISSVTTSQTAAGIIV